MLLHAELPLLIIPVLLLLPGDITAAELGQVMRELGLNPSDAELRDLVSEVDINNDGVISFDGVLHVLASQLPPCRCAG